MRDLKLGSRLDESSGRLVASREGIPVILAGMIERTGGGYQIAVRAVTAGQAGTAAVAEATASDKAQVLGAVGASRGERPRSARRHDPVEQRSRRRRSRPRRSTPCARTPSRRICPPARRTRRRPSSTARRCATTPSSGAPIQGWPPACSASGDRDEAEKNWDEALRRIDRMTEREKLRTFGGYYLGIARNYDKAIETYEELVAKYPADSAGHNNLAIAYFSLLNFAKALEYGRKAIEIYPKTFKYRSNYALYAMYAGDFSRPPPTTAQELIKEDPKFDVPYLPLAMEALAAGRSRRARATTYQQAARPATPACR